MEGPLPQVKQICLGMPEATFEEHGEHVSFLIRRKVFTYYLNNHHSDGIVGINCKVLPGDNIALIKSDPKKFYMPAYIGSRGWVGLRLDVLNVDWDEASSLISGSYQLIAPKKLSAIVAAREQ
jgi:predicted DNA-binding protein (MmcQ/YjbR family)